MIRFPIGTNLYLEAPFDVRKKLQTTFERFGIKTNIAVLGESLLRMDIVYDKNSKPYNEDYKATVLFEMLRFYKSLN